MPLISTRSQAFCVVSLIIITLFFVLLISLSRIGVEEWKTTILSPSHREFLENKNRAEKLREMMRHAWLGYRQFAWGTNELKPIAREPNNEGIFGSDPMMATIIDAADTLWIMGLDEEFQQAHDQIRDHFNVSALANTSLFVHIGGLLSLHTLTKENVFREKAEQLATLMLPTFDTPTGIPTSRVMPNNNATIRNESTNGDSSVLAELGTLHMEFAYLTKVTGNPVFAQKVKTIQGVLDRAKKRDGLYPTFVSQTTGEFVGDHVSLGAQGDSFFETLLKTWLLSGKTDDQAFRMYKDVSTAIQNKMVFTSKGNLSYVSDLYNGVPNHKMAHLACFVPGMFVLEAMAEPDEIKKEGLIQLAESIGHTCHESYRLSKTGLGPEEFGFTEGSEAMTSEPKSGYIQRPEAIEGWFYLWRATRKTIYKDWVFDAITAIDRYCRVESGGFAGLQNVYKPEAGYDDVQQTFFLAETLKYAYLTFEDDKFPLDKWVFNTEGHPFPILKQ